MEEQNVSVYYNRSCLFWYLREKGDVRVVRTDWEVSAPSRFQVAGLQEKGSPVRNI